MAEAKRQIIENVPRLHSYADRQRLAAMVARSGQSFTYVQDMVVVRANGPQLISDKLISDKLKTDEMFVVG